MLSRFAPTDERVVIGPGIGHDAAVISFGDRCLVTKTDPITFASDEIGWYAVHVNANDVACTGARPRWFLVTLLFPQACAHEEMVEQIFAQIADTCQQLDVALVGGHTEITHGIDRPIVIGFMLGEMPTDRLVRSDGAQMGDVLLLTKGIAVEGTAIIAREKGEELAGISESLLDRCQQFLYDPGISVVRDAMIAVAAGEAHAMHDPTEGGLANGLWEMAEAAGVGLEINEQAIPIYPETRVLCDALGLNPLGLIASGSLLLAIDPGNGDKIKAALEEKAIEATVIGRVVERDRGTVLRSAEGDRPLPRFERDEIARLFE